MFKFLEIVNIILTIIIWLVIFYGYVIVFLIPQFKDIKEKFLYIFKGEPVIIKVYLDDERKAPDGWIRVRTYWECITALGVLKPTHLSLDHDLGEEKTGYDVVKWIEEQVFNCSTYNPPIITVHSANPAGRQNMERGIKSIEKIIANR